MILERCLYQTKITFDEGNVTLIVESIKQSNELGNQPASLVTGEKVMINFTDHEQTGLRVYMQIFQACADKE